MSLQKYNQTSWTSTLCSNLKATHHLHTNNPNYISKPPLQIYTTDSKPHYNPRQSIDRDIIWKPSSKKVPVTRSQDYIFRSVSKKVDEYHKKNNSGNIIAHTFVKAVKESGKSRVHPAVEKRKDIRAGKTERDDVMSRTSTTMSNFREKGRNSERPNYMNSKLMRQTLQYQYAPNQEKKTYMPKTLRNK